MDLFTAINARYSYRGNMEQTRIPRTDLRKIVECGLKAPSGKNAQTTEFIIIDDNGILQELHKLHPANKAMQQAPAMIACVVDTNPEKIYASYDFQLEDCAAAVENMLLAITALKYASVWIDGWLRGEGRADAIAKLLHLPPTKKVQILLPVGIPVAEGARKEKKPFEQRAWFNTYMENKTISTE
ncbi:MAG: nitroreductase family protein [Desulfuromonadaceae bacterium]|nr:nitroreductase family protein [Desulfuromonas sp.]MDY0213321.1 nitroreductase family protein [Desulfuromonadaceae bacterium]